jgi:hypothetical protein
VKFCSFLVGGFRAAGFPVFASMPGAGKTGLTRLLLPQNQLPAILTSPYFSVFPPFVPCLCFFDSYILPGNCFFLFFSELFPVSITVLLSEGRLPTLAQKHQKKELPSDFLDF